MNNVVDNVYVLARGYFQSKNGRAVSYRIFDDLKTNNRVFEYGVRKPNSKKMFHSSSIDITRMCAEDGEKDAVTRFVKVIKQNVQPEEIQRFIRNLGKTINTIA